MADNYTALKSSQKKRYISKETFNSLDLSKVPVGSEYEVVNPIEKGDLSADINNALNKAEKSIPEPTNQTTGSDGDVLVKKGTGSEWKSGKLLPDGTPGYDTFLVGKGTTCEWKRVEVSKYTHLMYFRGASEEIILSKINSSSVPYNNLTEAYTAEKNSNMPAGVGFALDIFPVKGSIFSNEQVYSAIAINKDLSILYGEGGAQIDIASITGFEDVCFEI